MNMIMDKNLWIRLQVHDTHQFYATLHSNDTSCTPNPYLAYWYQKDYVRAANARHSSVLRGFAQP